MDEPEDAPPLDLELLRGFAFECRPDCGLCCYAEPRVLAAERARLLTIVPEAEFEGGGRELFLSAHPNGGACRLLEENRCRAHPARPHPCREFPLTVHVGTRLQATVVLSCPGVGLSALSEGPGRRPPPLGEGFATELAALRERVDRSVVPRLAAAARRRRKVVRLLQDEGRWVDEEEVRDEMRRGIPMPVDEDFPVPDPPSADDGIESLPLFFDRRAAPVAIAQGLGGWELLELSPRGGRSRSLGVVPPPDRRPELAPDAARALHGYLRYWLERDALFGAVHLAMAEATDGSVVEWVADELRGIGALVLARAVVRAKLARGIVSTLSLADLQDGVRATDQDLLDRGSWGDRF
ncbi:MAG: YkgJ family cysteine cluster protein [Thermoplasmata archaeon]